MGDLHLKEQQWHTLLISFTSTMILVDACGQINKVKTFIIAVGCCLLNGRDVKVKITIIPVFRRLLMTLPL